jgi:transcriptional regulator with XRE-family HTH domain
VPGRDHLRERQRHRDELRRLGGLLQGLRREAGLRQVELAERLGRSQSYVTKYETGERRLDLVELEQVCRALGADLVQCVRRFTAPGG